MLLKNKCCVVATVLGGNCDRGFLLGNYELAPYGFYSINDFR